MTKEDEKSMDKVISILQHIDDMVKRIAELEVGYNAGEIEEEELIPITDEIYEEMQKFLNGKSIDFMAIA